MCNTIIGNNRIVLININENFVLYTDLIFATISHLIVIYVIGVLGLKLQDSRTSDQYNCLHIKSTVA